MANLIAMTRRRKIVYGTLAGLLGTFIGFLAVEHIRGALLLRQHLAALKRQGETMSVADLKPEPVADKENAATFFLNELLDPELTALVEAWAPPACRMAAPGRAIVGIQLEQWGAPPPEDAEVTDEPRKDWAGLRAALEPYLDNIETLRSHLARPGYDTGRNYDSGFTDFSIPPFAPLRRSLSVLRTTTMLALRDGDPSAAVRDLRLLARLCDHQGDEPLIISQLVRLSCATMALGVTWEALQAEGLSDSDLAAIQEAWLAEDYVPAMTRSLRMERAMTLDHFRLLRTSREAREEAVEQVLDLGLLPLFVDVEPVNEFWLRWVHLPLWRIAWVDHDTLNSLRRWASVFDLAQRAESGSWIVTDVDARVEDDPFSLLSAGYDEERSFYDRSRHLFSGLPSGVSPALILRVLRVETHRNMAVTAVAIRRFVLREGRLPESVSELTPAFLPEVPLDRMNGQALRYRSRSDGTFLLYSVGVDGVDDGGDPTPSGRSLWLWTGKDAVWPSPVSREEAERAWREGVLN
jgi:hypothetical protein